MSSSRSERKASRQKTSSAQFYYCIVAGAVVLFFGFGVFVGTRVVQSGENVQGVPGSNLVSFGSALPGTKNTYTTASISGRATSATAISPALVVPQQQQGKSLRGATVLSEDDKKSALRSSLHATNSNYATIKNGDKLDAADILVAAYIYLDEDGGHDSNMRPVFSNKNPGCNEGLDQHGFGKHLKLCNSVIPHRRAHLASLYTSASCCSFVGELVSLPFARCC
jgi:hypothetical protein